VGSRSRRLFGAIIVAILAAAVAAPAVSAAPAIAPFMTMSFSPGSIGLHGTTSLNFTIFNDETNPTLTGLAFTDTLPAGLSVANGSAAACGGTLTPSGGNTISLSGGTLLGGGGYQCTFAVTVTGQVAGDYTNTAGAITSNESGAGNQATASLTVLAPPPQPAAPTIAMSFGASTVAVGESTSLTFTISNPNSADTLTGIGFVDGFPGGLMVAYPSTVTGSCGGGTITADSYTSAVSLSGATLVPLAACTFSVDVTGAAPGVQTNTTGNVTSTESGPGGTATATLTVGYPPTMGMSFNPATILPNGTSALTFGLYNPETSSTTLTGLGFTVILPAGLTVAGGSASVCPFDAGNNVIVTGTVTTSGGHTISLTGVTLPPSWVCTFSVTVTGPGDDGEYTATSSTLTSDNGIPGGPGSANLVVGAPEPTAPPTSTAGSSRPGPSEPALPLVLVLAFGAGLVAVRWAGLRGLRPGSK
jgi:hypothetical protein